MHCGSDKQTRPTSIRPTMDLSCAETDKGPPVQGRRLRELEQHLNDLKKENFSLKLRIYFLEEKIQQRFEESRDQVHRRNIELKVEAESLKKELQDRQELLDQALSTAEALSNQNEAELQRRLAQRQQEISPTQDNLETKVRLLEKEAQLARDQAQKMASLADSASQRCLVLEREMVERMEETGGSGGPSDKDRLEELTQQKHQLSLRVQELEVKVHDLTSSLKRKEQEAERSGSEAGPGPAEVLALQASLFQTQLDLQASQRAARRANMAQENQNRSLERLETDLQEALQHRRDTETHNQELQLVLQEVRSSLQDQEEQKDRLRDQEETWRTIQDLRTSLQTKDKLLEDYYHLVQDPDQTRGSQVLRLRQRLRDRDQALQRALDEKIRTEEQKDEDNRCLQLLIREKDRDLDRQRCVLSNNEETISSLEVLLKGKVLELDRVSDAWRTVQRQQQDGEDRLTRILRERDVLMDQLQEALRARTQEVQDLRCSLLAPVHSVSSQVLEELKVRLQLKDRLFQEVLIDRTHQAQEHQDQVQDLLRTIRCRDQYLQDSAARFGEVLAERTSRIQELRRQLDSGSGSQQHSGPELQVLQEELRLALRREKENQDLSRSQAAQLDSLSRTLNLKEDLIRDLQRQLVVPSDLPLVERLTQEVQELREVLVQQDAAAAGGPELGGLRSDEEDEELRSDEGDPDTQDLDGPGLMGVRQLVEQKQEVERELKELKTQLETSGFSSLSHIRRTLLDLQDQNRALRRQLAEGSQELWDAWDKEPSVSQENIEESQLLLSTSSQEPADQLEDSPQRPAPSEDTLRLQQTSRDLQERLMVSEATVQVQVEQLKDYRDLLTETVVQQDSKQVQVDLQDPGYETCGRSETEAERDGASSPEFDDLEMCTSLDCGSQWWSTNSSGSTRRALQGSGDGDRDGDEVSSLQRLVEELRSQLSRSQEVIRGLHRRLRLLSTSSGTAPSLRKVNWSCLGRGDEDEGWQSSDGGASLSPRHPDKDLQKLTSRVDALEDQLRTSGKKTEDGDSTSWTGNLDSLIKAQARELSHLRQRLREGRGVCGVLTQHLGDTTRTFEELLRANDVDYYMGQSFREQLAQAGALAQRITSKIGGGDGSEGPEEKTELLAVRLSKELQQKDRIIESLRSKLNHHRHHHRPDSPCSGHALSDPTDQSDRVSYVSDDPGSTTEDPDLGSDVDCSNEPGPEETQSPARTDCRHSVFASRHPSAPPSVTSSHGPQSCVSCPSMHCCSSPLRPADVQSLTGFSSSQSKPLHGFLLAQQTRANPSSFQSFGPSPFSSYASSLSLDAGVAMRAGAGLLESSALWEMTCGSRAPGAGADLSSGSSGYQSGTGHTGADLMKEHLREIRSLRQRLEDSIQTNERLRQHLEGKMSRPASETGGPTNIYIQGLDSLGQLSSEVRLLKEENLSLQEQLKLREGSKEAGHLREAVLQEQSRVKEAELDAGRWAELSRQLQAEAEAHRQEATQLKQDRQRNQETINRLQHEVSVLRQQLDESRSVVQQLHTCCTVPENVPSSPGGDTGPFGSSSRLRSEQNAAGPAGPDASLLVPAAAGSSHQHGRHAVGHVQDFKALQQQLLEASALLLHMQAALWSLKTSQTLPQPADAACVQKLLLDSTALNQILKEAHSLLDRFWRAALTDPDGARLDPVLMEEVVSLRLKLSQQEAVLQETRDRLRTADLSRDSMELLIVSQLSRTRDVLKKAKTNLQVKTQEASPPLLVGVS